MRRLFIMFTCLPLTACFSDTAAPLPSDRLEGRYLLRRMNGEDLPQVYTDLPTFRLEIIRGVITLHPDSTFADSTELRRTENSQAKRIIDVAEGRYQLDGDTLRLNSTRGERYKMAFSSRTLTQQLGPAVLVYRK